MAYLNQPATTTTFGVIEVGANIIDTNGVISIAQDISPTASPSFAGLTVDGKEVVTTVTPTAGNGINISNVTTGGLSAAFTISNTGVLSLLAGTDISVSSSTGTITVSDTSTLQSVATRGATTDKAISITNSTASSGTTTGALVVTGGVGVGNKLWASQLFDDGNRVVTGVTATGGTGISITSATTTGPSAAFTVNNTGVTSLTAGTGISVSGSTGSITISNTGTSTITVNSVTGPAYSITATDEYIGVNSTSLVTLTLPAGVSGRTYIIKDEHGAGFGTIAVTGTGGQLVDGQATYTILVPLASITVVFNNSAWHII